MLSLSFSEKSLSIQKQVVVEEFKQNYLNQPYGDVWHHISDMAFKVHPYRWPTIGKIPQHVEEATLDDVKTFYDRYYRPNNAILTIAGPVKVTEVPVTNSPLTGDVKVTSGGVVSSDCRLGVPSGDTAGFTSKNTSKNESIPHSHVPSSFSFW